MSAAAPWYEIVGVDRSRASERVAALRTEGLFLEHRSGNSRGPGVLFFGRLSPELRSFLHEASDDGLERVLAVALDPDASRVDAWELLAAGASDVIAWSHCRKVERVFDAFPDALNELHRGILPFRVWQIFQRMMDYAAAEPAKFVAAAGVLSHYVGDACQPLHGSTMSDGIPDEEPDIPRDSQQKDSHDHKLPAFRGKGVHSAYETQMVNSTMKNGLLFPEIATNLGAHHAMPLVHDGKQAAVATLSLMRDVAAILPPRHIIDVFEQSFVDGTPHTQALWAGAGTGTGQVMALGIRTLAMLWDAAWAAGAGNHNPGAIEKEALRGLYEDTHFVRSVTVNGIEQEIAHPSPLG
jgi:hypothetical protein